MAGVLGFVGGFFSTVVGVCERCGYSGREISTLEVMRLKEAGLRWLVEDPWGES